MDVWLWFKCPCGMAGKNKITKEHYETLAGLRYALRKFMRFSESAAHAAGLTSQQHQAMLAIKGFPGRNYVNVGELAERLQILHHSAVGLVDRMVAEKLLERKLSSKDRRQVFIRLTSVGERKLERLSALHRQQLKQVGPELSRLLERLNITG